MAAENATADAINFMATHGRGIVCLPVAGVAAGRAADPADGVGAPSSRRDRVHRVDRLPRRRRRRARAPTTAPRRSRAIATRRPAPRTSRSPATSSRSARKEGGVLRARRAHRGRRGPRTLAGLFPAGVICEVMQRRRHHGAAARTSCGSRDEHGLKLISIADLIEYRRRRRSSCARVAEADDPHRARRVPLATRTRASSTAARTWRWCSARSATATRHPDARALRVPDRRRVRLAALRLRDAARTRDGA